MKEITIKDEYIKMNQLMKLCGYASQGSDVKYFVESGLIRLNGKDITELRKKGYPGDIVSVEGYEDVLVKEAE